jgi:hypothetical protein
MHSHTDNTATRAATPAPARSFIVVPIATATVAADYTFRSPLAFTFRFALVLGCPCWICSDRSHYC